MNASQRSIADLGLFEGKPTLGQSGRYGTTLFNVSATSRETAYAKAKASNGGMQAKRPLLD